MVQFGAIASALAGDRIFGMLGMPVPEFVAGLQENKLGSCMGAFMLGNLVSQNLIATGARRFPSARAVLHLLAPRRLVVHSQGWSPPAIGFYFPCSFYFP